MVPSGRANYRIGDKYGLFWYLWSVPVNCDTGLTLTYFTARSNLVSYEFVWGKLVKTFFNESNLK